MPPEEEYSRRSERGTVMNILQQVLRLIDNPLTDDQERVSFARHKLSFLLHWLKMQEPEEKRNVPG